MIRRRGRGARREQVANAWDDFVDLTPVSEAPAAEVDANWAALLPDPCIPLIGEDKRYGY